MIRNWRNFFILLYLYRCVMSVLGELFVSNFTSLADANRYQRSSFTVFSELHIFGISDSFDVGRIYSTLITESIGALFHLLFGGQQILIDIGFQSIAFVGIYKLLNALDESTRRYLALLVLTPSFSLWSSVASKEALIVFFIGIICAYLIKLYENRGKLRFLEVISAVGIFMFKVHYIPALLLIYASIKFGKYIKQKSAMVVASGMISLIGLYLAREKINRMSLDIIPHFRGLGSSREAYWVEQYDVFAKAPYGMFMAFFGPTLSESNDGLLKMASFLESTLIICILLLFLLNNLGRLPVFSFLLGVFATGWLLFASYPLGIMNAGSAVRYRTGHLLLVFFIFAIIFSRNKFIRWRGEGTESRP